GRRGIGARCCRPLAIREMEASSSFDGTDRSPQEKCRGILAIIARNATIRLVFGSAAAQQQISRPGPPVLRLSRRDREDVAPQLRLLQPARNRTLEDARPARAKSPPGDDEHATPSRGACRCDEGGEFPMSLGLGHPVKIEAYLDPVQTAL